MHKTSSKVFSSSIPSTAHAQYVYRRIIQLILIRYPIIMEMVAVIVLVKAHRDWFIMWKMYQMERRVHRYPPSLRSLVWIHLLIYAKRVRCQRIAPRNIICKIRLIHWFRKWSRAWSRIRLMLRVVVHFGRWISLRRRGCGCHLVLIHH